MANYERIHRTDLDTIHKLTRQLVERTSNRLRPRPFASTSISTAASETTPATTAIAGIDDSARLTVPVLPASHCTSLPSPRLELSSMPKTLDVRTKWLIGPA
ncbi:unnamed protein product [Protopolystoma xenopodis]|uniref:Uncharacterized protein n=1 Tax=Protopolystoma xenopodis TaxID=117903 RepID=A0A3S5BHH4_9PLAT|nr:unnamed protein product [Protopolystoma xenopodis]